MRWILIPFLFKTELYSILASSQIDPEIYLAISTHWGKNNTSYISKKKKQQKKT